MIRMTMLALGAAAAVLSTPAVAQSSIEAAGETTRPQATAPLPTDTPPEANTPRVEGAATQSSLKSAVRKSRSSVATSMVTTGPTEGAVRANPGS